MRCATAPTGKAFVLACLVVASSSTCLAGAMEVDCDPSRTLGAYTQKLTEDFSTIAENADDAAMTREAASEGIEDELASRATPDGLAGGRLDFLRRAFVALQLGDVSDAEAALVFNFNPEALRLERFGQFSPRIIVHAPALYEPLDQQIDTLDETVREARRDALEEGLGELDDVEYTLRYTPHSQQPTTDARHPDLQNVAAKLYDTVVDAVVKKDDVEARVNDASARIKKILGPKAAYPVGDTPMQTICEDSAAKAILTTLINELGPQIDASNQRLEEQLDDAGFFRLADLVDGEPRLVFNGTSRQRSNASGPDETKLNVTWQWGWISYSGARRFAAKQSNGKTKDLTVDTVNAYFKKYGRLEGALPLFSLVGEYSRVSSFRIQIPGVTDEFLTESTHKLTARATAGRYLGADRGARLELAASYDDVSDDPLLQDRFVANLTWTQQLGNSLAQLAGGPEFVVTVVYANKPEFVGEVDEDFGLQAGIKWSMGQKKN